MVVLESSNVFLCPPTASGRTAVATTIQVFIFHKRLIGYIFAFNTIATDTMIITPKSVLMTPVSVEFLVGNFFLVTTIITETAVIFITFIGD